MVFDTLCAVASKFLPVACPWLHDARLFDFPYRSHEVLPAAFDDAGRAVLRDHFFLPFPVVAIEDTASVIVLVDTEPEQRGLTQPRYFVECVPMRAGDADEFRPDQRAQIEALDKATAKLPPNTVTVTVGRISNVTFLPETEQLQFDGSVAVALLATPDRIVLNLKKEEGRTAQYLKSADPAMVGRGHKREAEETRMSESAMRNVAVAMQEVMYLNTPNRFIVEDTPTSFLRYEQRMQAKKRRNQDPTKRRVLRSAERPTYILLTPDEIRAQFNFPTPAGTVKRAHERRRHLRTYPDDPARWPKAHGRTVVVPASWVGPNERKTKTRRYRVLLDI